MIAPRSLLAIPVVILSTIVFGLLQIICSLADPRGRVADAIARTWSRTLAWASGLKVSAAGADGVDRSRSYVLVVNHQSHLDTVCLFLTSPVPVRMLAKASLFRIPFLGWAMARMGHVPVLRDRRRADDLARLEKAVDRLVARGQSLVVFAEGTRSNDGTVAPFRKGAFHLAGAFGLAILPVAIDGTTSVLPARTLRFRGGGASVTYLPPVDPADREVEALLEETRGAICRTLGQPS